MPMIDGIHSVFFNIHANNMRTVCCKQSSSRKTNIAEPEDRNIHMTFSQIKG